MEKTKEFSNFLTFKLKMIIGITDNFSILKKHFFSLNSVKELNKKKIYNE